MKNKELNGFIKKGLLTEEEKQMIEDDERAKIMREEQEQFLEDERSFGEEPE